MAFEVPHKHDISLDGQEMRNQMIENFKAIEQEDKDDDQALSDEAADRKEGDGNLQGQIDKLQERCQKLDQEKATHDDVNDLRNEMYQIRDDWHDRASHIARGTDVETTKAVVEQILQEKGLM